MQPGHLGLLGFVPTDCRAAAIAVAHRHLSDASNSQQYRYIGIQWVLYRADKLSANSLRTVRNLLIVGMLLKRESVRTVPNFYRVLKLR